MRCPDLVLPEPLGSVALALRDQRLALTGEDGWLMASRNAGTHITAERLCERLTPYGITSPPRPPRRATRARCSTSGADPRGTAWLPEARAAQWVRAAGATYAGYVALRTAP